MSPTAGRHFTASVPGAAGPTGLGRPLQLDSKRIRVGLELRAQSVGIEPEGFEVVMTLPVSAVRAVAEPLAHAPCGLAARGVSAVPQETIRCLLRVRDDLPVVQVQDGAAGRGHA